MRARWLVCALPLMGALPPTDVTTLDAMQTELERSTHLALPNQKTPYFISYWTVDYDQHDVSATLGKLIGSDHDRGRRVSVELRVGDRSFDNSNFVDQSGGGSSMSADSGDGLWQAPVEDPTALRRVLWLATDSEYKDAASTYEQKNAARQNEVAGSDDAPSFSPPHKTELLAPADATIGPDAPRELSAERISAVFRDYPAVQDSEVSVSASVDRLFYVSNEGSRIAIPSSYSEIQITCRTQSADGMALELSRTLANLTPTPPDEKAAVTLARRMADDLVRLRDAPLLEDYSGPVLFEGLAAPQILHELLSDSLSGTPAPKGAEWSESALARKLGKLILPPSFTVVDDPTQARLGDHPLLGHYLVDDEGVPAQRVSLVEHGRLKSLLMSRTPRKTIADSNGHGRNGLDGWARGKVANLIAQSSGGLSHAALVSRLIRAVREENGSHGLIIRELKPRPSATSGQAPPDPVLVVEVGLDGKERLVRGGKFGQLSVRVLRDVVATGTDVSIYDYAEPNPTGMVTTASVASPSLLFEDIEVKRKNEPNKSAPIVTRPPLAGR